jgi:uncharacterized damage-inducible protein DinB
MSTLESLIDRYARGPSVLAYAIEGLADEPARARPGPGVWSIAELAAHLADSDMVASDRMKRVIAEDDPILQPYDETAWINRLGAHDAPIADSVAIFTANRRWTERILRNCSESDFARSGRHAEQGRITLAELLVVYVNHLDHHLRYLYTKRANLGTSLQPRYSYPTA